MLNNIVETMDDETTCLEHNNQDKTKDIAAETVKVVKHTNGFIIIFILIKEDSTMIAITN
jgi:diacylglycerol kinase